MKKSLVLSIFLSLIAFSIPAAAGPVMDAAACGLIITGKTIKGLESEFNKAKTACEALRHCKYNCRGDKKALKREIKNEAGACKAECKVAKLKGKKEKGCKKKCSKAKKLKLAELKVKLKKADKSKCQQSCKYPMGSQSAANKACFDARGDLARAAVAKGLEEAGNILTSCVP